MAAPHAALILGTLADGLHDIHFGPFHSSGLNPQFAGAALIYIINVGMVLPGASAPASIFHSLEGLPDSGMRTKVTLFGCACTLVVSIPLFTLFSLVLG